MTEHKPTELPNKCHSAEATGTGLDLANLAPVFRSRFVVCDGCWPWTGHKDKKGYGVFHPCRGRGQRAHRLMYGHANNVSLGPRDIVCHRCDNPSCVNPSHLFLGTHADNRADCVAKGRQAKGEKNGRSILTDAQVVEIRRLYIPRKMSASVHVRLGGLRMIATTEFPQQDRDTLAAIAGGK